MYGSHPSRDLNQVADREQQMSSSLLRYRSAPSSLFGDGCEDFLPVRPSSPETETIFARFLPAPCDKPVAPPAMEQHNGHFSPPPVQQLLYPSHHQMHTQISIESDGSKNGGSSNLMRQSSSPAGLFAHLSSDNGYGAIMRGINGTAIPAATRLKGQISFSSRQSSIMSQISEMGSEGMGGSSPEGSSGGGGGNARSPYIPGYQSGSWDENSLLSDSYSGLKRARAADGLNQTENHNGELRSSSEMATIEKFLQFQDAVPCKIRAKRGCATHPRSIAERVRRTRISERMRKLQELVPNMDKQTNTADMLDLAVEHIKDLQKQVKTMSDGRVSCTCPSNRKKPYSNSVV